MPPRWGRSEFSAPVSAKKADGRKSLSPRIVAPPRLDADGTPVSVRTATRPSTARRTLFVGDTGPVPPPPTDEEVPSYSVPKEVCRVPKHVLKRAQEEIGFHRANHAQREKDAAAKRAKELQAQGLLGAVLGGEIHVGEGADDAGADDPSSAPRVVPVTQRAEQLGVSCDPDAIDAWPSHFATATAEHFARRVRVMDREQDPLARGDAAVTLMDELATHMTSFKPVFRALANEVRRLVTQYVDQLEVAEAAKTALESQKDDFVLKERGLTLKWQQKVDKLENFIEMRKREYDRVDKELSKAATLTLEAERARKSCEKQEAETLAMRRSNEATTAQFAAKNRELEEQIPYLVKAAEESRSRSEQLHNANERYAKRIHVLETEGAAAERDHQHTSQSLQAALAKATNSNAEYKILTDKLKAAKERLETQNSDLSRRLKETRQNHEHEVQSMTPRPSFRDRDMGLFGSLTATANRVDSLSQTLEQTQNDLEEAMAANRTLAAALSVSNMAKEGHVSFPARCAEMDAAAAQISTQGGVPAGCVVPQFLLSLEEKVKCRAMSLREVVYKIRELFDTHHSMQSRTNRTVSMGNAVLCSYADAHRQANSDVNHKPNAPISLTGNEQGDALRYIPPHVVTEQCYSILHAAEIWSGHPVVRMFGCAIREEVGVWLWQDQNRFVGSIMQVLAKFGSAEVEDLCELLATCLQGEGFSMPYVLAAQHHLRLHYAPASTTRALAALRQLQAPPASRRPAGQSPNKRGPDADELNSTFRGTMRGRRGSMSLSPRQFGKAVSPPTGQGKPGRLSPAALSLRLPASMDKSMTAIDLEMSLKPSGGGATPPRSSSPAPSNAGDAAPTISSSAAVKVDFDANKNNPKSATMVLEQPMVFALRAMFLDRTLRFNAEFDKALERRSSIAHGKRQVNEGAAVAALMRVVPVDLVVAQKFVSETFQACQVHAKAEMTFIRSPPEIHSGLGTSSWVFLPGFTGMYFGSGNATFPPVKPYVQVAAKKEEPDLLSAKNSRRGTAAGPIGSRNASRRTTGALSPNIDLTGIESAFEEDVSSASRLKIYSKGGRKGTPSVTPMQVALTPQLQMLHDSGLNGSNDGHSSRLGSVTNFSAAFVDATHRGSVGAGPELSSAMSSPMPTSLEPPSGGKKVKLIIDDGEPDALSRENSVTPQPPPTGRGGSGRHASSAGFGSSSNSGSGPVVPLTLFQRMFRKVPFNPAHFAIDDVNGTLVRPDAKDMDRPL